MDNNTKIHAFTNDALADHDATAIAQLIRSKEVSVQEVADAAIKRAALVNPTLNAIQQPCFEQVQRAAEFRLNRIFSGVPFFFKDNVDFIGLKSQQGSHAFQAKSAKKNWQITEQILDQGVLVLGKTKLPEFGLNASTEFQDGTAVINPWHTAYSCGASSGGAAALVASGVVPIAHANDGGGSIRIPAAACGLVGLKPSRGRFKEDSARFLPINIISEGVLTRSVRDTANFIYGMEQSYQAAHLKPIGLVQVEGTKRLRIGVIEQSVTGNIDQETRTTLWQTAELLQRLGHQVSSTTLPIADSFVDDFSHYWGSLSYMMTHGGKVLFGKSFEKQKLESLTIGLADMYKQNMWKTPFFIHRLKQVEAEYRAAFRHFDVILSPVLAHTTPKIGYLSPQLDFDELFARIQNYVTFTPIHNVAGSPALSLPMGETEVDQRPIGMMFSADVGDEKTLLELAFELEQAQPWRRIQD
jgi:amidase